MTLSELAKEISAREPDVEKAIEELYIQVEGDKMLRRECVMPFVKKAIYDARHESTKLARRSPTQGKSSINAKSLALASATHTTAFLDAWRVGGKSLGQLTRVELIAESQNELTHMRSHAATARFFNQLAALVPAGKTVSDVVKHGQAQELWEKAQQEKRETKRRGRGSVDARQVHATV